MALRVLDDDPGFAILCFDKPLAAPALDISVRASSELDRGYLGPGGAWSRTPHYFTAERVEGDAAGTRYRVGPEIVNHLLEHMQIEIATRAGDLHESTVWQNAVPQMLPRGQAYAIHQPGLVAEPKVEQKAAEPPPIVKVERENEPQAARPVDRAPAPKPPPRFAPYWLLAIAVLLALAAAAVALSPDLRCTLFGLGCAVDTQLQKAMACANEALARAPCEVEACFAAYPRNGGGETLTPEASRLRERGVASCFASRQAIRREAPPQPHPEVDTRAKDAAYADAKACAGGNPCLANACYEAYLRLPDVGAAERANADRDLAEAAGLCEANQAKPSFQLADGEYSGFASAGCGAPSQGVTVNIKHGAISWRHNMPIVPGGPLVTSGWEGVIDSNGDIHASVNGLPDFSASGQYNDVANRVVLHGPNCGGGAGVTLTIRQKMR